MNRLAAITILLTLSSCATPAAGADVMITSDACMPREKFVQQFLVEFKEKVVAKGVLRQNAGRSNMMFELTMSSQGNFTLAITGNHPDAGLTTCLAGEGFGLKILGDAVPGGHKI